MVSYTSHVAPCRKDATVDNSRRRCDESFSDRGRKDRGWNESNGTNDGRGRDMRHRLVMLTGLLLMTISSSLVGSAWGAETKELRVCGDPDNLPFSNKKREGFENKIAEVIAKEVGAALI